MASVNPLYVEVILSEEYLTEDGLYQAGYRSGEKGQYWGEDVPDNVVWWNMPELFKQGNKDGLGDFHAKSEAAIIGSPRWVKLTQQNLSAIKVGTLWNGFPKGSDPNASRESRDKAYKVTSMEFDGITSLGMSGIKSRMKLKELADVSHYQRWFWFEGNNE